MAFTFGFYNSHDHDRIYDAKSVSRIFDGLVTDGVYSTIGDRFIVKPSTEDNTVIIGSGRAWFDHTWNYNDTAMLLEGPAPHTLFNRWDAIVLDINTNVEYRINDIIWVQGTAASTPVKPTMVHEYDHNQYPLAYVYRRAKVTQIEASDIENVIGTAECPYSESSLTDTKNIAPVEENDTATRAYVLGEYIIWHNALYKITTPISKDYNIIPAPETGYNVMRTTIAEELYQKFIFDSVPIDGSLHPVTSTGIYKALGNRAKIPDMSAPAANGNNLISNGQVYTALGNRTSIQTSAPTKDSSNLITSGQVWAALGNRSSLPTAFSAPVANGGNLISNGQVYTALGNRTSIQTSAPTSGSSNLITSGEVYSAFGSKVQLVTKRFSVNYVNRGETVRGNTTYSGSTYKAAVLAGWSFQISGYVCNYIYVSTDGDREYYIMYELYNISGPTSGGPGALIIKVLEILA